MPCCFSIDVSKFGFLAKSVDLHFGPQKWLKIIIFGQNRRLKVHNMYFKWLGSILLVNSISLVAFLLISVHPGTSLDLWTFIWAYKRLKPVYLIRSQRLKVHNMNFKWFGSTLLVNSISLLSFYRFQCIWVPHYTCRPSFWAQKWLKSLYLVKIDGSRSIVYISDDFDPIYWSIWYALLLS